MDRTALRSTITERRSTVWWTVAVALTIAVAVLSLGPQLDVDDATQGVSDKALHAAFYAALAGAYLAATRARLGAVTLIVFAYGVLLELLQMARPERTVEALDLAANAAGVLVAALLTLTVRRVRAVTSRPTHREP